MTEPGGDISFRLWVRFDPDPGTRRRWLVVPLEVGSIRASEMVPNTVATRSVITPSAARRLRLEGLLGADVVELASGRTTRVLSGVRLAGRAVPDLEVRVRDVPALKGSSGEYLVDGYLGLDFFLGLFRQITIDTRTLRITLRPDW
jgi:hypothetical protein